jgi:hypothetical protein
LYANFNHQDITPNITVLFYDQDPYLVAFPYSTNNQLVIMTIAGLNQVDSVVNNIRNTLFVVYQRLHTLVEQEIAEEQEFLRLDWTQRISDSWEVSKRQHFYPPDFGWLQYRIGPTVPGMIRRFDRESWEIYRRSDVLWEEKEMLWISSLGEHRRMLLRFPSPPESESESESEELASPSNSESEELNEVLPNSSNSVTGNIDQSSDS